MEVLSLKKLKHECSFFLMNGKKAKVININAIASYVLDDWEIIAMAYEHSTGTEYYLVVKDE